MKSAACICILWVACAPAPSRLNDSATGGPSPSVETAQSALATTAVSAVSGAPLLGPSAISPPLGSASASASATEDANSAASACAEADVRLDLRAWPTNQKIDIASQSTYEASKFRDAAPKGAKVRVYPSTAYGFVARVDAESLQKALAQCAATLAAYLPGAPTRHPLDHSPVNIQCHRCSSGEPEGTQGLLQ